MSLEKQELRKDTESNILQIIEANIDAVVTVLPEKIKQDILAAKLGRVLHSYADIYEGEVEDELVSLSSYSNRHIIDTLISTWLYKEITENLFDGAHVNTDYFGKDKGRLRRRLWKRILVY
jgi:hypothetical protein